MGTDLHHQRQEGGFQFVSKMTSNLSKANSQQSAQNQINESSIDGIKHLSMTVTHKDEALISHPELSSQRKNQMIRDQGEQDQLKKQTMRKSQNPITHNTAIDGGNRRAAGPTIIHIQAPPSATGTKSKQNLSPSAVSQSMKHTSMDKKRPSPKFDTKLINNEVLVQQIQKEDKEYNELLNVQGKN